MEKIKKRLTTKNLKLLYFLVVFIFSIESAGYSLSNINLRLPVGVKDDRIKKAGIGIDNLRERVNQKISELGEISSLDPKATQRLNRLTEIGMMLSTGYSPDIFTEYSKITDRLLSLPASQINFIMASEMATKFATLLYALNKQAYRFVILHSLRMINKSLIRWDSTRLFFYIPGLPVIVEGASEQEKGMLEEVAKLIRQSGWLDMKPDTFQETDIFMIAGGEKHSFAGIAGSHGHPMIVLVKPTFDPMLSILYNACTLIHEDQHQLNDVDLAMEALKDWEPFQGRNVTHVTHPWLPENASVTHLFDELKTYGVMCQFCLHVLAQKDLSLTISQPTKTAHLAIIKKYIDDARDALEILSDSRNSLPRESIESLDEIETLWKQINSEYSKLSASLPVKQDNTVRQGI